MKSFAIVVGASLVLCAGSGCGIVGNAPLPRHAAIESAPTPQSPDALDAVVERADIFYLPIDRIASERSGAAAARLLKALARTGTPFATAWAIMGADQQPQLEQWLAQADNASQTAFSPTLFTAADERENCRRLLAEIGQQRIPSFSIRLPESIYARLRRNEELSAAEKELLPSGYTAPATKPSDREPAASYQFAAERIVQYLRSRGTVKLLVLINRRDVEASATVPFYVAQKLPVRQLILDSRTAPAERALLTLAGRGARWGGQLQVVDRAPAAALHRL